MRILAVGDVHSKFHVLNRIEKVIKDYDAVVFVGDYADDWKSGPLQTIETWRAIRNLQEQNPNIYVLIGNHDYIYVNYTKSISSGYNRTTQLLIDEPNNEGLKAWLKTLPVTLELDGVTYSHAGVTETYTEGDDLWSDNSPIWARPADVTYRDMPQVFGHTPSKTCWEIRKNVWCIDTFSTYSDGSKYGDETVLEIIDGKEFNKIKL